MIKAYFKHRSLKEELIKLVLFLCAFLSVLITAAIVFILIREVLPLLQKVKLSEIFLETQWTPLFEKPKYGLLALLSGTIMTTVIALLVALPLGLICSFFLSEYLSEKKREIFKPLIEILASVPTVIYGYFALLFVTPLLKNVFPQLSSFNALSAGLVMGVMIIPYVSSLSEDAMRAVPIHLREGSLALGASKLQTCLFIIFPAAFSGITAAFVLAMSRAVGETMIVAIAAGLEPKFSLNPFRSTETLTAYVVQVSQGDLPHGSIGYQTIYLCGITLFLFTLFLNLVAQYIQYNYKRKNT